MKIKWYQFDLESRHTFTISKGSFNLRETLIVELSKDGKSGFGEAVAIPYYGITRTVLIQELKNIQAFIEAYNFVSPQQLWVDLFPKLQSNRFLLSALDVAAHDLDARLKNISFRGMTGLFEEENLPVTNYTIGLDSIEMMVAKMVASPYSIYKIKLGVPNDIEIVKNLRMHTDSIFRIDANGAWTAEEAVAKIQILAALGVEFIEEPLLPDEDMAYLYKNSPLPLIADESCQTIEDIDDCVGRFHGINIKLMKCGGLTPALEMIAKAKEKGLKIMLGCMTESSIGITAAAQLLPFADYADLDGSLLLKNDPAFGVAIENGKIIFPKGNGMGSGLID